jgi:hypothetical protein
MEIAWFIVPYKRRLGTVHPTRYCAMDDYSEWIINIDGGNWVEIEVLGNHAVVKVKAEKSTLDLIAGIDGFIRFPVKLLNDPLNSLSQVQKTVINNKLQLLGYSTQEIKDKLGSNISSKTLGDLLKFIATKRLKPRYDRNTDTIVCDGIEQIVGSIDNIDKVIL